MADVVRFVYPSIGTVGVSSQTATQMIPQPKISFVYPLSSALTNIQPRLTNNVNQQIDNILGSQNVIFVTMDTPNLQQIQSFPVVSRQGDVHIHQDPMNGQLYQMTDLIHQNITKLYGGGVIGITTMAQRNGGVITTQPPSDKYMAFPPITLPGTQTSIQLINNPNPIVSLNSINKYFM